MLSLPLFIKRIARWRSYIQLFVGRISIAVSGGSWSPAVDGNAQLNFAHFCWLHWNYAKPQMLLDYHQQLKTYPEPCSRKTVTSRKIIANGQNRHGCFKLNEEWKRKSPSQVRRYQLRTRQRQSKVWGTKKLFLYANGRSFTCQPDRNLWWHVLKLA